MKCDKCGSESNFEWAKFCSTCQAPLRPEDEITVAQEKYEEASPQNSEESQPQSSPAEGDKLDIGVTDPMDYMMRSKHKDPVDLDPDAVRPEPIENELTLYRDQDVKLTISENGPNPKVLVEALKDDLKISAEHIAAPQEPETTIEPNPAPISTSVEPAQSPAEVDPSETQEEDKEKIKSTSKIDIISHQNQGESPAAVSLHEVKHSRGVIHLSGKDLKLTGGTRVNLGDEIIINGKTFDVKKHPGKSRLFYLGIGGAIAVLFLIVLLIFTGSSKEIGQLVGSVISYSDGKPLANQTVALKELGLAVSTNQAGFFVFDNIPAGIYTISYKGPTGAELQDRVTVINDQTSTVALEQTLPRTEVEQPAVEPSAAPAPIRETAVARSGRGTLSLTLTPSNASAYVDDKPLGVGSNSYKLLAGEHDLVVRKSGYIEKSRTINIESDRTISVNISLDEDNRTSAPTKSNNEIAQEYESAGSYHEALQYYDRALARNSRDVVATLGKARCYRAEGLVDNAMNNYLQAAKLASDKGDVNSQLTAISAIIELKPNTFTAYASRGDLLYSMGKFEKASEDYAKVIEFDKRNLAAYYKIGDCFYKSKDYSSAVKAYRAAEELNFADPKAQVSLAKTYLAMGDKKNTKKAYEKFTQLANYSTRLEFRRDPDWQKVLAAVGEKQ